MELVKSMMANDKMNSVPPPVERKRYISMPFVVSVYVILLGCLIFLPFGFDKRSSLGLDFEHLMLMAFFCVLFWLIAFVTALVRQQISLVIFLFLSLIIGGMAVLSSH